jgi:hypothetical protein
VGAEGLGKVERCCGFCSFRVSRLECQVFVLCEKRDYFAAKAKVKDEKLRRVFGTREDNSL